MCHLHADKHKPLLFPQCTLRRVEKEDKEKLFDMRNQEHVRAHMLNKKLISAGEHDRWFDLLLRARDKSYFVFSYKQEPVGVIGFFDMTLEQSNWTFYLGDPENPAGLGTIMCFMGLEKIFESTNISRIATCVLKSNIVSQRLHLKLGFARECEVPAQKAVSLILEKSVWASQKLNLQKDFFNYRSCLET